jgi:uncharacterized protein YuzE
MAEVEVWYDQEGDYLEVRFSDEKGTLEEITEDVFERRNADGEVIGFAVFNFSQHDRQIVSLPLHLRAVA